MRNLIRTITTIALASALSGCISVNLLPSPGALEEEVLGGDGDAKVLLVELSGVIGARGRRGVLDRQPGQMATFKETLTRAAEDEDIKALIIHINSPGGTVTGSDVLYHELRSFKQQREIPVVASIMDVGTSGAYYVASAADTIIAHPTSVTGSIGVLMLTVDASGLLQKIGVQTDALASGSKKGMGSPLRAMTPEEREVFQSLIDGFHHRFVEVIERSRPRLSRDRILALADGRVFSGIQAYDAGLVDELGYLDDALELAKAKAGVTEARIVTYQRPGEYRHNIYSMLSGERSAVVQLANLDPMHFMRAATPQFLYLWMP